MAGFISPDRPVVSPDWLFEHHLDPELIILDCRFALSDPTLGHHQYRVSHIPKSHYLDLNQDLSAPVEQQGGRHPLPDVKQLSNKLSSLGVCRVPADFSQPQASSWVVVYDDSRLGFAARAWWLLRYLGHDRVAVLDGGFSAWQQAGYPVTAVVEPPQPGQFVAAPRCDWMVDAAAVSAVLPELQESQADTNWVLIDSREAPRYRGEVEPIDPIAGHIPGALNYPWMEVTDAAGRLRSMAEQQQRWQALPANATPIVYCGSGVTACVNLLSLALAGRSGKLYAGSWSDWCSRQLPVEVS